jgi:hypothetical protein
MNRYAWIFALNVILVLSLFTSYCCAQQPLLQITAPATGSVAIEGQTITITVSVDPSVQLAGVLTNGRFPDMQTGSSPNQFLQPIPTTITPGIYRFTAFGVNSSSDVESDPISIDVEPQFFPTALSTNPVLLSLGVGDKSPIYVTGTFSDGSALDVSRSSRTTYSSQNTQIATVDSTGRVTAVAPGQTYILIGTTNTDPTSSSPYAEVMIQVKNPRPTGTPPAITDVAPSSGVPGTTQVTITGSGFGAAQGNGTIQVGTFESTVISSWTDTQIIATVPTNSTSGVVEVDQNGLQSNDVPFTISTPFITGISPAQVSPGMQITINGGSFGASQGSGIVNLGSTQANIISWSGSQIIATVAVGTIPGKVSVTQNGSTSNGVWFTMVPPVLSSLSSTVLAPGMQLTLTGSNFLPLQGTGIVTLSNTPGTIVSWSDSQIVVSVPIGTLAGTAFVSQDGIASNSLPFTMVAPVLASMSATTLSPTMQVTFLGSGFGAMQGTGSLTLNNKPGNIVSWNDTQIVAKVEANTTPGNAMVNQNGNQSNGIAFTMVAPALSSISATVLDPGMQITLSGSGFGRNQGDGKVILKNKKANITSWSDTQIVATVALDTTPGNAVVEKDGVDSNGLGFTMVPPVLTSISPTTLAPGQQITLSGNDFQTAAGVHGRIFLGGTPASIVSWTATQIVAEAPATLTAGRVFVMQDGEKSQGIAFTTSNLTVTSIAVTPGSSTISQGQTQQFLAVATYSDGSTQDVTASAHWSSSDPNIASVSNALGTQGLTTAIANGGVTTITAIFGNLAASASLSVQFND